MLLLPFPIDALAATLTVSGDDGTAEFATIAAAVAEAEPGDVIAIHPGTYVEDKPLELTEAVELVGLVAGGARPVLASSSASGFFQVIGEGVTLRDLDFVGAGTGDADPDSRAIVLSGQLEVQGCSFAGHRTDRSAPAAAGAAIRVESGSLTLRHAWFSDNRATFGGHVWLASGAVAVVDHSEFLLGYATNNGGAISTEPLSSLTVRASTFTGNEAHKGGGAIGPGLDSGGALSVWGSKFADNEVVATVIDDGDGGAIQLRRLEVGPNSVRRSLFCANQAERRGGAVSAEAGSLVLEELAFVANVVATADTEGEFGGAVANLGSSLTLERNTFLANRGAQGQALSAEAGVTNVSTTVFAHHEANGDPLLNEVGTGSIRVQPSCTLFGAGDQGNADTSSGYSAADPLIDAPRDPCDAAALVPADGSPLWGASGSAEAGAVTDEDGDGHHTLVDDCDDDNDQIYVGASEVAADGIDQNCDGRELCYADTDGDGVGEAPLESYDLDCADFGEAAVGGDDCVGGDDDGDGLCGVDDLCPGGDDRVDGDGDGLADDCDECPDDPSDTCAGVTDDGRDGRGGETIEADGHPPGCGCVAVRGGRWGGWLPLGLAALAMGGLRRRDLVPRTS
jgi:predicted outer membrane repeat protein